VPRCDFEADAKALLEMLDEPAHIVGHSYGGLIALLTASYRPQSVRSLALIEPPVMSLLRGDPEVEDSIATHTKLVDTHRDDPRGFLAAFTNNLGGDGTRVPEPLPPALRQHVELLLNERFPWEANIPTTTLSDAPFPKLALSGGHSDMQERMSDVLATAISARRQTISGAGHNVQRAPGCNEALTLFWRQATT
jgi:pimeloyl-ACP methyl ester carboxylesterase